MPQIETETTERDLLETVEELLAKPILPGNFAAEAESLLRRMVEEVKRLRAQIKTIERDAREEAQSAANEARWQERQGEDYGSY